ncbi:hypothetical protein [Bradyrhizobium genosp. P]|uniref:hypothetical protein n=1 Tax=Bradyrhizobium genosp. P TaxID=83641 RepID=UPI003CEA9F04
MVPNKSLIACIAILALTGSDALPAAASPWSRGFVVGAYEYAFRYGGRPDFTRGEEIEPGVDCQHGSALHFSRNNTDPARNLVKKALERQKWRSQQEINWIANPPGLEQITAEPPSRVLGRIWMRAVSYRGYKRGIETYVNPWAADDPGQPEVTSRIADGFNLDGKIGPHDFVSPDGERGIDNALYRAWGCDAPWRGSSNAKNALQANDNLRSGGYSMVLRISGHQDPMNDNDATVEIGYSPDAIVKDASAGIAVDYSYRILNSAQYIKLKAKIRDGVLETEQVEHLTIPRIAIEAYETGEADLTKGKIRLNIAPDGLSGTGLIGGYRNWRDLYAESAFSKYGAGVYDINYGQDHVALYYALRRNADGMYNRKAQQYDGISTAYRIKLASAYVVDADRPMDIPIRAGELWLRKAYEATKANTIKGVAIRTPQDVPPGSGEGAYPLLETSKSLKLLPSKQFFLETLDRPHYPDGVGMDENGNPIDDQGDRVDEHGKKLDEQANVRR